MAKYTSLIIIWLISLASIATAQNKITPPATVKQSFQNKYLGEIMVYEWRVLDDTYIVTFEQQGKYRYASFNTQGAWQEDGISVDRNSVPEQVYAGLPELDVTAFIYESFVAETLNDDKGYLLVYETDIERIDIWVSNTGKVLRKKHYEIPPAPEDKPIEGKSDAVDWGDGGR